MNLTCSDLLLALAERGISANLIGADQPISSIRPIEDCCPGALTFAEKSAYLNSALQKQATVIVVAQQISLDTINAANSSLIQVPDARVAMAYLRQRFDDIDPRDNGWERIHPSAVIHPDVVIPASVSVGPAAVISIGVSLAEDVLIMANAVIEPHVQIGARSIVNPACVIGRDTEIGNDVIIKAGAVIGAEGHGFARDQQGHFHRIPQRGKVVIEDQVVIGANCTIDRATYHETRVHRGCIIDAQCHLAHNVVLDEDCALVAQTGIAGSSRFGKRVMASGQTGVLDHVTVPDDTVLVHRAGVINSIKESGMYATTPPQPFARYLKNIAVFQRLAEVWERLRLLEKKVAKLTDQNQPNS